MRKCIGLIGEIHAIEVSSCGMIKYIYGQSKLPGDLFGCIDGIVSVGNEQYGFGFGNMLFVSYEMSPKNCRYA